MAREIIEVPITGTIISLEVKVGDVVGEGDTVCVLESMKMELPILTPVAGRITEVKVSVGQVVKMGEVIATVEY